MLKFAETIRQPGTGIGEAAGIVGQDPVLAAKVIKLANSMFYRGLRPSVAIEDAVARIGLQTLARLSLSLSPPDQHPVIDSFDLERYWHAAHARATAMHSLAKHIRCCPAAELYSLGLLADIGQLVLASTAREAGASEPPPQQLTAALFAHWSMPTIMIAAVAPHHTSVSAADGERLEKLRFMLDIANALCTSAPRPDALPAELRRTAAQMGLDDQRLHTIQAEIDTARQAVTDRFSAAPQHEAYTRLMRLHSTSAHGAAHAGQHAPANAVLITDDDASNIALLTRYLEPAGYTVYAASNAQDAIAIMQQSMPRILIIDWMMPGMNGLNACQSLRQQFGGRLYIVLLSAFVGSDRAIEALEAGANDFLEKPIERKLLLAKLRVAQRTVELTLDLEEAQHQSDATHRELTELNARLRQDATQDALTGLPNRRAFDAYLSETWAAARRHTLPIACIMLDIDHFKRVNDEHGHDAGDRALTALAGVLQTHSRAGDKAARYGGEEFVMLCTHSDLAAAFRLAERLRRQIEQLRGDYPPITISGGVAAMTPDMHEPAQLLRAADQCLLEAKRNGRNRIVMHATETQPPL
ncbi:hypothetical protein BW247_14805 [Acidihalobacter ferrooxydans]|uniref:diguanylate cyclase n=2 Tax=Acidihalobacter ferrooxydans TaxID=1765967 RepID=A0A1P8UK41_9GAMM|nr:hypothetical protein BW247_14805 [Acidihalobacter ferrooxydans]